MLKKVVMITLLSGLLLTSIGTALAQGLVEYAIIPAHVNAQPGNWGIIPVPPPEICAAAELTRLAFSLAFR